MSGVSSIVAVLAGAVVVLAGLVSLVRAIWTVAQTVRDNTRATGVLSGKLDQLGVVVDGRLSDMERRLVALESRGAK